MPCRSAWWTRRLVLYYSLRSHRARATLFPYTTLFRSNQMAGGDGMPIVEPPLSVGVASTAHPKPRIPDRKSTRLNSSHPSSSYAVFRLKKKTLARVASGPLYLCAPVVGHLTHQL